MKKRLLSAVLATCLLFSFAACGSAANKTETTPSTNTDEPAAAASQSSIGALADSEKVYGTTFGQGNIDVKVELSDEDWQDIKDNAKAEEYHSANITVNGTTVKNVGFRTKGFSSLTSVANSDSDRYGFKVKTDKYVDGQTLSGLDMFVLNACYSDPSYMREYLTYAASEYLGCDTPFVSYCRLYINGELFGFYLCIEAYEDSFTERYTESSDTVLYKAESEKCTLTSSDDGSGFEVQYGEDEDLSNIKNLISVLNSTTSDNKAELEKILDIDSVLKNIAVNTVMGNYDSYSGSKAHNYYLMYSNGKFSYLGWDYNMSIGGFTDNGGSVTADISSPVYGVDISQRPLIQKLLAIDEYYERYLGYVKSLVEYFGDFEGTVSEIANVIREEVKNDPTAFYTIEQFEANISKSDTDLSTKTQSGGRGGMGGGMQMPQNAQGADSTTANAPPAMPSGDTNGNMQAPNGGQMPGGGKGGQMPNGGQAPNGGDRQTQDGTNAQMPNIGEGQMPEGDRQRDGGGGGQRLSPDAVSIVDYITQRIENIKTQLGK